MAEQSTLKTFLLKAATEIIQSWSKEDAKKQKNCMFENMHCKVTFGYLFKYIVNVYI